MSDWQGYLDGNHDAVYELLGSGDGPELDGFQIVAADGGYDRPAWDVLNKDEIVEQHLGNEQPIHVCGYCGDKFRSRDVNASLAWWEAHDCATLYEAESNGLIYDLTPMLRANRIEAEAA